MRSSLILSGPDRQRDPVEIRTRKRYVKYHPSRKMPDEIFEVLSESGEGLAKEYEVRSTKDDRVLKILAAHTCTQDSFGRKPGRQPKR